MRKQLKDRKIEEFLEEYAENRKPDHSVTDKARDYLESVSRSEEGFGSPSDGGAAPAGASRPGKRRSVLRGLGFGLAVAAAAVCCVGSTVGIVRFAGDVIQEYNNAHQKPDTDKPVIKPPQIKVFYNSSSLISKSSSVERAGKYVDLSWAADVEGVRVAEVREYRFNGESSAGFDSLELAFVRVRLRIEGELSASDVEVNLETSEKYYKPFENYLGLEPCALLSIPLQGVTRNQGGEYLSNAYFRYTEKFYVNLMTSESYGFEKIMKQLFGDFLLPPGDGGGA